MSGPAYRGTRTADLAPAADLDNFVALFHRPSGVTHLLAEPAPQILEVLNEGAGTSADVLARLQRDYGLGHDDAAEAVIVARMEELAALGLISAA